MLRINLVLSLLVWFLCSFNNYILNFYVKYMPGNVFLNTIIIGSAELFAKAISGLIFRFAGLKRGMVGLAAYTIVVGVIFLFLRSSEAVIPVLVLLARLATGSLYNGIFYSAVILFPTHLTATANGISNASGRLGAVLSPLAAELPGALPLSLFIGIAFSSLVVSSLFIVKNKEETDKATLSEEDIMEMTRIKKTEESQ